MNTLAIKSIQAHAMATIYPSKWRGFKYLTWEEMMEEYNKLLIKFYLPGIMAQLNRPTLLEGLITNIDYERPSLKDRLTSWWKFL